MREKWTQEQPAKIVKTKDVQNLFWHICKLLPNRWKIVIYHSDQKMPQNKLNHSKLNVLHNSHIICFFLSLHNVLNPCMLFRF